MLLSLIILNARSAVLEQPNHRIDQVHNAAFSLVSLKQITAVLKIDMAWQIDIDIAKALYKLMLYL